jgi:hypothetical protein
MAYCIEYMCDKCSKHCSKQCTDKCFVGSWVISITIPLSTPFVVYGNMNVDADGTVDESDTFHIQQSNAILAPDGVRLIPNLGVWKKIGHRHYSVSINSAGAAPDLCPVDDCQDVDVHFLPLSDAITRNKVVMDIMISEDCETGSGTFAPKFYDKNDVTFSNPLPIVIPVGTITLQKFHL